MFFDPTEKNALAIEELAIRIETLNRDVDALLSELQVNPAQLTAFLNNKDNFTEENWETLQQQRKVLDEKLLTQLAHVSNPLNTKKAYADRNVQRHWLFVR